MKISSNIKNIAKEVTNWRHELHKNPELGYEESWTSDFITKKLESFNIEVHRGLGGTGVVGVLTGTNGRSNRAIGLRADMDALPIQEENEISYKSKFDGKMHACGHDGHVAMLLVQPRFYQKIKTLTVQCILFFNQQKKVAQGVCL